MRYALITNGLVENICEWDGDTQKWAPPQGVQAIPAADHWSLGGTLIEGVYTPPPPPPEQEPG
jgi:hypothetical protein